MDEQELGRLPIGTVVYFPRTDDLYLRFAVVVPPTSEELGDTEFGFLNMKSYLSGMEEVEVMDRMEEEECHLFPRLPDFYKYMGWKSHNKDNPSEN